ncbi:MAG: NUDIX domain-containing protein [Oscillospiraceae bacterium]|nr:NUDIX domain-containing protein [Oscillospiraceae bacterium]
MEYLDICDENGMPTGRVTGRTEAHAKGIRHRTAHVWVVRQLRDKYQVLLQKRSSCKDSFPGKYDTSSAGHIPAGDEPLASALRELEEELGIRACPDTLRFAGRFSVSVSNVFHGVPFRDNEVRNVYVYSEPVMIEDLVLQEDEVDEAIWFDLEKLCKLVGNNDDRFCVPPESLDILLGFLSKAELNVHPDPTPTSPD